MGPVLQRQRFVTCSFNKFYFIFSLLHLENLLFFSHILFDSVRSVRFTINQCARQILNYPSRIKRLTFLRLFFYSSYYSDAKPADHNACNNTSECANFKSGQTDRFSIGFHLILTLTCLTVQRVMEMNRISEEICF